MLAQNIQAQTIINPLKRLSHLPYIYIYQLFSQFRWGIKFVVAYYYFFASNYVGLKKTN